MNTHGWRVIAIAALVSGPIVAGCTSASTLGRTRALASTGTALPGHILLAQTPAPAPAAPTAPVAPAPVSVAPAPEGRVGLPRVREYRAIPELRDVYFDFGQATIRPADLKVLEANAAWLRAHPDQLVLIEGHCDDQGLTSRKNEFNMALGERRAQAAMTYLIAQGVPASRIITLSYGEERPLCAEQSERCWSQNRRSRFLVKPR
jgi:peptidoglycan-associated lipoprotein